MKKSGRKQERRETTGEAMVLPLRELIRKDLRDFVVTAGAAALNEILEEERTAICGRRYAHHAERQAYRSGHASGELVMGGRLVSVRRPRARTTKGREAILPSWQAFADEDPLRERTVDQMLLGVSTRRYHRSLEPLPEVLAERGTSKSAVSRRFVAATELQIAKWLGRDLSGLTLAALMIDGVHIDEHVLLVALGVDVDGKKHVLGIREGATECATTCTALLGDLCDRGIRTDRAVLVVLDGSKALRKAVREVFGERALVQRCQAHKARNVIDQLPEAKRPLVRQAMREAYAVRDFEAAKRLLVKLGRRLEVEHPGAASSLAEGLDETLTVKVLQLPRSLERQLSTTNAIENLIGTLRCTAGRVKRWRNGRMIVRWAVAALAEAARHFRRVTGAAAGMALLNRALADHDRALAKLESVSKAA